jgi:hypothetical protein
VPPFLRRLARHGAVLGALVVLAQCGGSDITLPGETAPASISKVDGDNQNGVAGSSLRDSLVVEVRDRRGDVLPGQPVVFAADGNADAQLTPEEPRTDSQGRARAHWVLGTTSGTQRVVATVVGLDSSVTFQALVDPAEARRIEAQSGNEQTAAIGTAVPEPLVVVVKDEFGNPVEGATVEWSAENGSVDPSESTTGPDGLASTSWILGRSVGQQRATASSGALDGSPVRFIATAGPGTATRLVLVSGNRQSAAPGRELPEPLVVRIVDREGNGVPGRAVSWVVGAGGGSVTSATSTTNGKGEAETRWTLGPSPGLNTLNAVVSGIDVSVVGFTATAVTDGGGGGGGGGGGASTPTRLVFLVQPSDTERDRDISPPIEVGVLDQNGNRVTDGEFRITLQLVEEDDDKLDGDTSETTEEGVARFGKVEVDDEGTFRLRAVADGLQSVESDAFEIFEEDD